MKKTILSLVTILAVFCIQFPAANAQDVPDSTSAPKPQVKSVSITTLMPKFGVREKLFRDGNLLVEIMDSIGLQHRRPYINQRDWCLNQSRAIRELLDAVELSYRHDDEGRVWIDSVTFLKSHTNAISRLEELESMLQENAENFDNMEQEYLIRREQAIRDSIQREEHMKYQARLDRLKAYKDTIHTMHRELWDMMEYANIKEKKKRQEKEKLRKSYDDVYSTFDLSKDTATDEYFSYLEMVQQFEQEMLDSIVGPNGMVKKINMFPQRIETELGKSNPKLRTKYNKAFREFQLPTVFSNLDNYKKYKTSLRDILFTQESYFTCAEIIDSIDNTKKAFSEHCKKLGRARVYSSYQSNVEMDYSSWYLPEFNKKEEAVKHIARLREQLQLLYEYDAAAELLKGVLDRNDSISNIAPGNYSVRLNFDEMVFQSMSTLTPSFKTIEEARQYEQILISFEAVQDLYIQAIELIYKIDSADERIKRSKNTPKGVYQGYRKIFNQAKISPDFRSESAGKDYINGMKRFMKTQKNVEQIIINNKTIMDNTEAIKNEFKKEYKNIHKAYEKLIKDNDYALDNPTIEDDSDINEYLKDQNKVLAMQKRFIDLTDRFEIQERNKALKSAKNVDEIKSLMNIID